MDKQKLAGILQDRSKQIELSRRQFRRLLTHSSLQYALGMRRPLPALFCGQIVAKFFANSIAHPRTRQTPLHYGPLVLITVETSTYPVIGVPAGISTSFPRFNKPRPPKAIVNAAVAPTFRLPSCDFEPRSGIL